jgi:hypothetical protein
VATDVEWDARGRADGRFFEPEDRPW